MSRTRSAILLCAATVEIVEHRLGSAGRTVIGLAGPGVSTFTISARRSNQGPTEAAESRHRGRDEIAFDRECVKP